MIKSCRGSRSFNGSYRRTRLWVVGPRKEMRTQRCNAGPLWPPWDMHGSMQDDDSAGLESPVTTTDESQPTSLRSSRAYDDREVQRLLDLRGRTATRAALARVDIAERHLSEFGVGADPGVDRGDGVATDGGHDVDPSDLTLFQIEALRAIATVSDPASGVEVHDQLESFYGSGFPHSRLYSNLDDLVEQGLVQKGQINRRSNSYELTSAGVRFLEDRLDELSEAIDALHAEPAVADGGEQR